jgi:predicted HNH restriction endonuclease
MKSEWVQDVAFPIIGRAIERSSRNPEKAVSRKEIIQLLLRDDYSRRLIETAYRRIDRKKSIEQYAGNMVDWFSQRWTVGDSKWLSLFSKFKRAERKIDGCWAYIPTTLSAVVVFPDDVEEDAKGLPEGAAFERLVNGYERNPLARQRCIDKYGTSCFICGFSFGVTYGETVDGLIHVHHLIQLSEVGKEYQVDPIADLRPVCPNCHAVIHHRRNPAYSIKEVQSFLNLRKSKTKP